LNEVLTDEHSIKVMKEELDQFDKNQVWTLVPTPENKSINETNGFIETN